MRDIGIFLVNSFCFDLEIQNDDLRPDNGLDTSVFLSLFTDQRVNIDELPPLENDRRGWWGDLFAEVEGDEIGSKLWTVLERSKTTIPTRERLRGLTVDALQWLIDDGVASSVEVDVEIVSAFRIDISIEITRPSDPDQRFDVVWNAQEQKLESFEVA